MRFVVDGNGRLRVPRPLLDAAGLKAGRPLEFELAQDGSLRVRAAPAEVGGRAPAAQDAFAAAERLDDLVVS